MSAEQPRITDDVVRAELTEILAYDSVDLATSKNGLNWSSNAFFTELDGDSFRIALVLESGGRTLGQLRANPSVGLKVVPTGLLQPFAQGIGTVEVLDPSEVQRTFDAVVSKAPDLEPFRGAPIDALVVTIDWWRVTHVAAGWLPGQIVHREPRT